jgi:hypothetical protein
VVALAVTLAGVVWLLADNAGSGVVAQTRSTPAFDAVELSGSNLVAVRVGAKQSVVVHARRQMLGRITTQVHSGTLVISDVPARHPLKGPMNVSITVPSLGSLTISRDGSGVVTVTGIDSPGVTVNLAGSGLLRASGTATRLNVTLGGSGNADLEQLVARDVHAVVSGSGRIAVTATASLAASVPGSGVVQYGGNPARLATSVTGSGVVIPG